MVLQNIQIDSVAGFFSEDEEFSQFRPRKLIPDRKSIKLMTRAVQIGVAAARVTLEQTEIWKSVEPSRRGMFVSASPAVHGQDDLQQALMSSMVDGKFSFSAFAEKGRTFIHPLWLVRGLSNNILGFSSAFWDFQGENMNYCQGVSGGRHAFLQAAYAIKEGRLDVALVGGSDSLIGAEKILQKPCAEGAAFVLISSSKTDLEVDLIEIDRYVDTLPYLGAGAWSVALWKHYQRNK
jgi:3-oxoacyl-(acyl-carrier-protein) synthase